MAYHQFREKTIKQKSAIYIEKRLGGVNYEEKPRKTLQKLITQNRLLESKTIVKEILNTEPFPNTKEGNIDVINALNFAIFYVRHSRIDALDAVFACDGLQQGGL